MLIGGDDGGAVAALGVAITAMAFPWCGQWVYPFTQVGIVDTLVQSKRCFLVGETTSDDAQPYARMESPQA